MMRHKKNTTLNLRSITSHFTEKKKIITLSLIIIMLSFTNITLSLSDTFYNSNVSALSYQTSTNIGFTFLPTLNVSLSSNNLAIDNLVPGGSAVDSNTITINVSTNIAEGYNLMATVGSDNNANKGYNTTNLVNTVDNSYAFTPLSSNIPNLSSFTNNTWGYSYSNDSGTTWISGDYDSASTGYNGLPLYTNSGIKLVEEADNTSSTVDFKIAARASSTQPSGEYTNVINFTAVSNTIPTTMLDAFIASGAQMYKGYFKMQDMTSEICKSIDVEESELQLIDIRDDKVYWVAKLKDGNCWMTQNLDLAGGTEITSELSDIPENYTLPTANGFQQNNKLPASSQTGFSDNTIAYVYNTGNNTDNCAHPGCYSYYSWTAATAGSGIKLSGNTNAQYSICPKNWRLPNSGSREPYTTYSDFYNLAISYGMDMNRLDQNTPNFHNQAGPNTTPNFLLSGYYDGDRLLDIEEYGYYWSATARDSARAYGLYFSKQSVETASWGREMLGASVRCLAQ